MMDTDVLKKITGWPAEKKVLFFSGCWFFLNSVQAWFMGLHPDESYYWLYSRFLDWGYFDHPPMVALFIKWGESLFQNTFGLRLLTIITQTISVYLLWKIVSKYSQNASLFILLYSSILLFHVYGFITTPDAPLFFFSVLFLYAYQRYVANDNIKWACFLALINAAMLYSKYHAVLILFFTLFSNPKLLKRSSFWCMIAFSLLLLLPHIFWQVENGYPSLHYHLFDRSLYPYEFKFTLNYLRDQVLVAGPLLGWFLYLSAIRLKSNDLFIKAIKYIFYGIFIFFLLSTFKGRVQAHWTLIGFIPLFILSYIYLSQKAHIPSWFKKLAIVNIALILLARMVLIFPIPGLRNMGAVSYYYGTEAWAKAIKAKAGVHFVIFNQGFQPASHYNYYNRTTKGFAYDSRYYRKTQYDLWPIEDSLRNKTAYYVSTISHGENIDQDTLYTNKGIWYGRWIDQVRTYQKVNIEADIAQQIWLKDEIKEVDIKISNSYKQTINFSSVNEKWACYLEYGFIKMGAKPNFQSIPADFITIPAHQTYQTKVKLQAPSAPGHYQLIFSIRTEPFAGSRNSRMIPVEIH